MSGYIDISRKLCKEGNEAIFIHGFKFFSTFLLYFPSAVSHPDSRYHSPRISVI